MMYIVSATYIFTHYLLVARMMMVISGGFALSLCLLRICRVLPPIKGFALRAG